MKDTLTELKSDDFQLFFIYDSHCPWSYAANLLVENIIQAYDNIKLTLLHACHFDGENKVDKTTINEVQKFSNIKFSSRYTNTLSAFQDSTLAANLISWTQNKIPKSVMPLLKALQYEHFEQGNPLVNSEDVAVVLKKLKLSPPSKCLQSQKLTKDAEFALNDLFALQEVIATSAIPALLLVIKEKLILLNHTLYLKNPDKIVEAIALEYDNY